MTISTAYQANVLLEDADQQLRSKSITFHVKNYTGVSQTQIRSNLLNAATRRYHTQGRVLSLMISEPGEVGKRVVSIRPTTGRGDDVVLTHVSLADNSTFVLGGEIVEVSMGAAEEACVGGGHHA